MNVYVVFRCGVLICFRWEINYCKSCMNEWCIWWHLIWFHWEFNVHKYCMILRMSKLRSDVMFRCGVVIWFHWEIIYYKSCMNAVYGEICGVLNWFHWEFNVHKYCVILRMSTEIKRAVLLQIYWKFVSQ